MQSLKSGVFIACERRRGRGLIEMNTSVSSDKLRGQFSRKLRWGSAFPNFFGILYMHLEQRSWRGEKIPFSATSEFSFWMLGIVTFGHCGRLLPCIGCSQGPLLACGQPRHYAIASPLPWGTSQNSALYIDVMISTSRLSRHFINWKFPPFSIIAMWSFASFVVLMTVDTPFFLLQNVPQATVFLQ